MMNDDIPVINPGLQELYPLFVGKQKCTKNYSFGPATREHYLVHYVLEGKGIFQIDGRTYHLSKGQCFLICPNDITFYKADKEQPWQYIWLAFGGEKAEQFLNNAGINSQNPIFSGAPITALFEGLYLETQSEFFNRTDLGYYFLAKIYELLFYLSTSTQNGNQLNQYIEKAINYISTLYSHDISIEKLALFCCLDRRYLCRIFKAKTGVTLQQYLLSTRLEKAYSLVVSTELSIRNIAMSVGYRDVYNFSRMFKKKYKKSPLAIRNEANGGL